MKRNDELAPEAFPQGVTLDQGFKITNESPVLTESKPRFEKVLFGNEEEFVETHCFEPGPIMLSEFLKR